ncbi:MAG: DUF475 domain-containing protein [bacterium]
MIGILLTVLGLSVFEVVTSVENAVINAEVLSTMTKKGRVWFLLWGILFAVFVVRGVLPWAIIWLVNPHLGPLSALIATFSGDPGVRDSIESTSPLLLAAGGTFLVFLFLRWLFLEKKQFGLPATERFFMRNGAWFYAAVAVFLALILWITSGDAPLMAYGAAAGTVVFFVAHTLKWKAERSESTPADKAKRLSDIQKIFYLEIIDASFSIDGVLGAFAFTLSVPLILIGNGIGALVVRQLTVRNIAQIKRYVYLKNGAMYSMAVLGVIMLLHASGLHVPEWLSPLVTLSIVGFFLLRSKARLA